MLGKLHVGSTHLADILYKRPIYCQTSGENGALASLHMTLVYIGAREPRLLWILVKIRAGLKFRKKVIIYSSWLTQNSLSLTNFKHYLSAQRIMVK